MARPYVYILTHNNSNQFYIGSRWANNVPAVDDLGKHYFTSSKHIKPIFDQFRSEIVGEFDDRKSAFNHEQEMIAVSFGNPLLLNKAYCRVTDNSVRFFGIKTSDHRNKISAATKGKSKNAGRSNHRYGNGEVICGSNNPNSKSWRIINNKTGAEYVTDDLVSLCKSLNVPYTTIATATEYKPTRTWFAKRIIKEL